MMIMNNLEFVSDQVAKIIEMLADAKIGPRSSRASSRSTSDVSRRSSGYGEVEVEDDAAAAAAATDEAIQSFIESDDFSNPPSSCLSSTIASTRLISSAPRKPSPLPESSARLLCSGPRFGILRKLASYYCSKQTFISLILVEDEILARLRSLEDDQLIELYIGLSKRRRAERKGKGSKAKQKEGQETELPTHLNRLEKRKAAQTPGDGAHRTRGRTILMVGGRNVLADKEEEEQGEASTSIPDDSVFIDWSAHSLSFMSSPTWRSAPLLPLISSVVSMASHSGHNVLIDGQEEGL
ncbi:hypothetical protein NW762_014494 [Fusarium torreyae]|uniref:Uncharacterized protein n=1 Tax=Fusarium torreyae TaxID=1237075 RepID=A0A9W8RLK0_9HYPO|nr:hypothetical protein NW762_014494 [Fusarium torreyae]